MTPTDDAAITDAAHVLREKIDVLLDRLTDVVLGSPSPGTAGWHSLIHGPGDLTSITRGEHRTAVRALIAAHAGVADPTAAPRHPPRPTGAERERRHRSRVDPAQLSFF